MNRAFLAAGGALRVPAWESVLKTLINLLHPHWAAVWIQAILVAILAACFYARGSESMLQLLLLHLATFFFTALVCHGELARSRPDAAHLTEFYIWMSARRSAGRDFQCDCGALGLQQCDRVPHGGRIGMHAPPNAWTAGQPRAGSLVRSCPSPLGMVPFEGHREVRASRGLDHAGESSACPAT